MEGIGDTKFVYTITGFNDGNIYRFKHQYIHICIYTAAAAEIQSQIKVVTFHMTHIFTHFRYAIDAEVC